MTRRIFRSILTVAAVMLASSVALILGVLYEYYTGVQEQRLRAEAALIARAAEVQGADYLARLDTPDLRITWIDGSGEVRFDSEAGGRALESHADRQEFLDAVASGRGESARYSDTLTKRMFYAAERLGDGSVIRVSSAQSTVLDLVLGLLTPFCIILFFATVLSGVLAARLSRRIVQPLNELDLDHPPKSPVYEELSPMLSRIERQYEQISAQRSALLQKHREWTALTGSMNEGLVLLSEKNEVLSINKSAARLLDTEEGCVGADFFALCPREEVRTLAARALRGAQAELLADFDGETYQLNASPVLSDTAVVGAALLFFNVTARAHAEQMRREFTANVSHELKTPLHIIAGTAELLKDGLVQPEDQKRFTERIYAESQRMRTLIADIMALSKLDEGVTEAPRTAVSLLETAEAAAEQLAPAARERGVTLRVSGDAGVIEAVAPLLGELVCNLADNAIKYNRPGGSVALCVSEETETAVLTVSDTGIGIPAEHRSRIFERFYRVDKSHSRAIGGTGLGLSIVKHIARLHGASVEVQSTLGAGSTFTVRFPKHGAKNTLPADRTGGFGL